MFNLASTDVWQYVHWLVNIGFNTPLYMDYYQCRYFSVFSTCLFQLNSWMLFALIKIATACLIRVLVWLCFTQ